MVFVPVSEDAPDRPQSTLHIRCINSFSSILQSGIFTAESTVFGRSFLYYLADWTNTNHRFAFSPKCTPNNHHIIIPYSLRKASTGSFFDAIRAGKCPPRTVRIVLMITSSTACCSWRFATPFSSVRLYSNALTGYVSIQAITMPNMPENTPSINVSASNTRVISFFLAPKALSTPISVVRSRTDVYVMIPIMIKLTTSEIAAKAQRKVIIRDGIMKKEEQP